MRYTTGDLLDFPVIAHQCNCTSRGVAGIAKNIFAKYRIDPYAEIRVPGTVRLDIIGEKRIYSIFSQRKPGGPSENDTQEQRHAWLVSGLQEISGISELAIPKFGCGLAKGKWPDYEKIFSEWEIKTGISVVVVEKIF